jgi:transposase
VHRCDSGGDCHTAASRPEPSGRLAAARGSARKNLRLLLAANKRLNTAYMLKNPLVNSETTAARPGPGSSSTTGAQLKWQRLKPYEEFADMIERHWDGMAAYCKPDNRVSLGFVEGLNNKTRVL